MKVFIITVLACILAVGSSWEFPGYPGVDCPTARERMLADPKTGWMIPKCNENGTFVDLQCLDGDFADRCMCVALDGTPLTLPGFGLDISTCVCVMAQYEIYMKDKDAETLKCAHDGSYEPLQCSEATGECWCVDRNGHVLVPPSKDVHTCSN